MADIKYPGLSQITFLVKVLRGHKDLNCFEIKFEDFADSRLPLGEYRKLLALAYNYKYAELLGVLGKYCKRLTN